MSYVSIITAITNNDTSHALLTYGILDTMLGALFVISLNLITVLWRRDIPILWALLINSRHYHSIGWAFTLCPSMLLTSVIGPYKMILFSRQESWGPEVSNLLWATHSEVVELDSNSCLPDTKALAQTVDHYATPCPMGNPGRVSK